MSPSHLSLLTYHQG